MKFKFYTQDGASYARLVGDVKIRFSKEVSYLLGITNHVFYDAPWLESGYVLRIDKGDVTRMTLSSICVMADFVKETKHADGYEGLLRIVATREHALEYHMILDEYVNVQSRL